MTCGVQFLLREGCTNIPHYGIRLAEVAGMPASVVEDSRKIAGLITEKVMIIIRSAMRIFIGSGFALASTYPYQIALERSNR